MAQCWYIYLDTLSTLHAPPLIEGCGLTNEGSRLESRAQDAWGEALTQETHQVCSKLSCTTLFVSTSFQPPPSTQCTLLHRLAILSPLPRNPCLGVPRMLTPLQCNPHWLLASTMPPSSCSCCKNNNMTQSNKVNVNVVTLPLPPPLLFCSHFLDIIILDSHSRTM